MDKTLRYDAESIQVLSPRESVRQNLGMYIGNSDSSGLHQLFTEIVANSIDEAVAGYGNFIIVSINTKTNAITIRDEGRGLPFGRKADGTDAIIDAVCSLHGGGKFEGATGYKSSLGLHGLGLKVTHYLSSYFEVCSCRDGKVCRISFDEDDKMSGPLVVDEVTKINKHGTQVTFIPDSRIFGNNKWNLEIIKDRLQTYALLNNNIRFDLIVDEKKIQSYCYSDGIKDLFNIKAEDKTLVVKPTYHKIKVNNENGDEAEFEFAVGYTEDGGEREYCYANGGETPNGGSYLTGFKSGYTSLINKLAKAAGAEKNFSGDLIRRGLLLIMIMRADFRLSFAEQTKLTLNSPEARSLASKAISSLKFDNATLKALLKKIESEQKVEEAAQRKREAQEKITHGGSKLNALKDLPEKLADATDFENAEIFFCEGDSAAAGLKEMKKPNQAVLPLRGKIKNTASIELPDVLKSETITSILNCLGCGVGEHFNINHLRYKRILLLFDADADGAHIENLFITLALYYLPELIKAGKVYAIRSPIYKVTTARKEVLYFYDESEAKKWMKLHTGYKSVHIKGLGELNAQELYDTSMNPATRHAIQLTTADIERTLRLYGILMGNSPSARRQFIMSHKLSNYPSDEDFIEDDDEEAV